MVLSPLDPLQVRVLGVLVEKQLSTPEYYPLTLNALVNGCNQSSNRDPVLRAGESEVEEALEALREVRLARSVHVAGSRVLKYEHRVEETFGLTLQEAAVLAELLLRGPQTPGELRSRSGRMYAFQDLEEVEASLQLLMDREDGPLVRLLARQPGMKEARFAQLLGAAPVEDAPRPEEHRKDRVGELERQVADLREELAGLRQAFEDFRRQFD